MFRSPTRIAARAFALFALGTLPFVASGCVPPGDPPPPPATPPPQSMVMFVGEGGTGNIDAIDLKTFKTDASFHVGGDPVGFLQVGGQPTLYVLDKANDRVDVVDTRTNTVQTTVPTGRSPVAMIYIDSRQSLFVANEGDKTITQISIQSNSVVKTSIALPAAPLALSNLVGGSILVLTADNKVLQMSNDASTLGSDAGSIATYSGGPVNAMAAGYDGMGGTSVFVSQTGPNAVKVMNEAMNSFQFSAVGTITMTDAPTGFAYYPTAATEALFTIDSTNNRLTAIEMNGLQPKVLGDVIVGSDPVAAASDYSNYNTFVADNGDDTVDVVSDKSYSVIDTIHLAFGAKPVSVYAGWDWYIAPPASPSPSPTPTATPTVTPTPTATPTAMPTATPTPAAVNNTTLYVVNGNAGNVLSFPAPQSASETPTAIQMAGGTAGTSIATDGHGTLAVSANSNIYMYNGALTPSSNPFATISTSSPNFMAFDAAGDMFATTFSQAVYKYSKPFTTGEQPTLIWVGRTTAGIAFDSSGTMYVADRNGNVDVVAPPYASNTALLVPTPAGSMPAGIAISNGNLFVSDTQNQEIYAYTLPLTASSTPYYSYTVQDPEAIAFDGLGNLYVSNDAANRVDVYFALSPQAPPQYNYSLSGPAFQSPFGLTFGP